MAAVRTLWTAAEGLFVAMFGRVFEEPSAAAIFHEMSEAFDVAGEMVRHGIRAPRTGMEDAVAYMRLEVAACLGALALHLAGAGGAVPLLWALTDPQRGRGMAEAVRHGLLAVAGGHANRLLGEAHWWVNPQSQYAEECRALAEEMRKAGCR